MVFDDLGSSRVGSLTRTHLIPTTAYGAPTSSPDAAAVVLRAAGSRFGLQLVAASNRTLAVAALMAHVYGALTGGSITAPARHGSASVAVVSRALQLAAGLGSAHDPDPESLDDLLVSYTAFNETDQTLVEQVLALASFWSGDFETVELVHSLCIELLAIAPNSAYAPLAAALADAC